MFISFFSPKQKIGSGYIGTFYLPVAILSSVLSRCVMQLQYSVGVFFFSSSSICFLHPILVCKRLNNLLYVLLTENSLRKTPLIATLFNLLPFLSFPSFYFILVFSFKRKYFFSPSQPLSCPSSLPSDNIVSLTPVCIYLFFYWLVNQTAFLVERFFAVSFFKCI